MRRLRTRALLRDRTAWFLNGRYQRTFVCTNDNTAWPRHACCPEETSLVVDRGKFASSHSLSYFERHSACLSPYATFWPIKRLLLQETECKVSDWLTISDAFGRRCRSADSAPSRCPN